MIESKGEIIRNEIRVEDYPLKPYQSDNIVQRNPPFVGKFKFFNLYQFFIEVF